MTSAPIAYEQYVRAITEALLRAQGLQTVVVQHDIQVQGTSRSHQVDVYWEYRLGGVLHRVVINCKRYKSTVAVTDVLTLSGVLSDLPGVRGLIVSTVGFQRGAIDYARHHQIGLKIIRPPQDSDWEGRIRSFHIDFVVNQPELTSCAIDLDQEWVSANGLDRTTVVGHRTVSAATSLVRDADTGQAEDLNALWNRAVAENPTQPGATGEGTLRWGNAFYEVEGARPLKVAAIRFGWVMRTESTQSMTVRSEPAAIVRDALAGTLLFVDPDGRVSGDVEEAL